MSGEWLVVRAPQPQTSIDFGQMLAPLISDGEAAHLSELRVALATLATLDEPRRLFDAAVAYRRELTRLVVERVVTRDGARQRTYARFVSEWLIPLPSAVGDERAIVVRDTALRVECVAVALVVAVALINSSDSIAKLVAARRVLEALDRDAPRAVVRRSPLDARARGAAAPRLLSPLFIEAWIALIDGLIANARAVSGVNDADEPTHAANVEVARHRFDAMHAFARAASRGLRDAPALALAENDAAAHAYVAVARAIESDAVRLEHAIGVAVACAREAKRLGLDDGYALELEQRNDRVYGAQTVPRAAAIVIARDDAPAMTVDVDDATRCYRVTLPR